MRLFDKSEDESDGGQEVEPLQIRTSDKASVLPLTSKLQADAVKKGSSVEAQPPVVEEPPNSLNFQAQSVGKVPGKLTEFLQLPPSPSKVSKPKSPAKVRVLTSEENLRVIEERERQKEEIEMKEQRCQEREEKRRLKEAECERRKQAQEKAKQKLQEEQVAHDTDGLECAFVSTGGQETGSSEFAVNYGFTVFVWMYHES